MEPRTLSKFLNNISKDTWKEIGNKGKKLEEEKWKKKYNKKKHKM